MLTQQALNDAFSMEGKVVLVTGASSGLGAHFAQVMASAGANVILGARRAEKLAEQVQQITEAGGTAMAVSMDVTDADSVTAALDQAEAAYGPVTVLINNAGVADSKRFVNVDEDSWDFVMDTNLKSVWRLGSEVARRLLDKELAGSIVNIASILGLGVSIGESVYATSKAGVVQMTKAMSLELGYKGIRVNALCPGYFKTEMNSDFFDSERGQAYIKTMPARRLGNLDELNAPLLLLASDAGSFINGVALPVDGAQSVNAI